MRQRFSVTCPDWGEDEEDSFKTTGFSSDDAVDDWCAYGDKNSWFCDGYPQNLSLKVVDEVGHVTMFRVNTEFEPHFYFREEK